MSRRSDRRKRRDTQDIANRRLPLPYEYVRPGLNSYVSERLRFYEDRRQWHPEGVYRPARSFSRSFHRLRVVSDRREPVRSRKARNFLQEMRSSVPVRVGFQSPDGVLVCVRRKQRREVLHALRKTGRGGQRRPVWNWYSRISCRR